MNREWQYDDRPACCRWLWPLALAWLACALLALWFGSRGVANALESRSSVVSGGLATDAELSVSRSLAADDIEIGTYEPLVLERKVTTNRITRYAPLMLLGGASAASALTLHGDGLSQTHIDALKLSADSTFGRANVKSLMTATSEEATSSNLGSLGHALFPAMTTLQSPGVGVEGQTITLSGQAMSDAKRLQVAATARQVLGTDYTIKNNITVGTQKNALAAAERAIWNLTDAPQKILDGDPRGVTPRAGFALAELVHVLQNYPGTRVEVGYESRRGSGDDTAFAYDYDGARLIKEYLSSLGLGRARVGFSEVIPGVADTHSSERVAIRLIDQN